MSVQKILDKINTDAARDVEEIRATAKKKAENERSDILKKGNVRLSQVEEKEKQDVLEVERRSELNAGLQARKNTLEAKRKLLDEAFELAAKQLSALPNEQWAAVITKIVLQGVQTGDEKLCVPAGDKVRYSSTDYDDSGAGRTFLDVLNDKLVESGRRGELTIDDAQASFDCGVMLIGEISDIDGSFEALLEGVRVEYESEAATMLFGAEV